MNSSTNRPGRSEDQAEPFRGTKQSSLLPAYERAEYRRGDFFGSMVGVLVLVLTLGTVIFALSRILDP